MLITPAKMALSTIRETVGEEFLECKICLEDFKQPKMLPCLHTFCQPCLERLLATEPAGKLSCPTCRLDVPLPKDGVREFKNSFFVAKLGEVVHKSAFLTSDFSILQEPEHEVTCTACNTESPSAFYCVDCTDYLCQVCKDAHGRMKIFQSHKVVTMEDVRSGKVADDLRTRETSKCPCHKEVNKFYCATCLSVICLHCIVVKHKDHDYLEIEQAAERERGKIQEKLTAVQRHLEQQERWVEQVRPLKLSWPSQLERCAEDINVQAERMIHAVMKVKNEKLDQLRSTSATREKQLNDAIEAAEMELTSSKGYISFADKMLRYGSPAELLSVAGDIRGWLEQGSHETSTVVPSRALVNLRFDSPTNDLDEAVATLFGGVKQVRIGLPSPCTTQVNFNKVAFRRNGRAKLVKAAGTKGTGDMEFRCPLSLAMSIDDDIIVVDRDNSRLQVLKKNGSFKGKVDLDFHPQSVAALTNGELLVTGDEHKIHVLDSHGRYSRLIEVREAVEKDEVTNGVAVDSYGRIIVSIAYQVFVLNLKGEVLYKFGEKGCLNFVLWIATTSSNQILVSDELNHTLKVFDISGRLMFSCGSQGEGPGQLYHPVHVLTDIEDNIIVADNKNHRVSLFGRDGTFVRHVLTTESHGVMEPLGLTLTREGNLVVSDRSYEEGCIKIFRLS